MTSEQEWQSFCGALGNPPWAAEEKFGTLAGRLENLAQLDAHVARWTQERTSIEITELLQGNGLAAMPVMNIEDQFWDPHLQERRAYLEVEHPHVGIEWLYGMPWLLGNTPGGIRTPAPLLGEHNALVFRELLGLSAKDVERLQESEVIY